MIGNNQQRLVKIYYSIKREGLWGYLNRLYDYGEWRRRFVSFFLTPFLRDRVSVNVYGRELVLSRRWKGLTEELVLAGLHEPCASQLYVNKLSPGQIVLDIGANVGYYIALADSVLQGDGEIHAFEPDPELNEILVSNSRRMYTRVITSNGAVSDADGEVTFYRSSVSNWGSIRHNERLAQTDTIKVPAITIDTYCMIHKIVPNVIRMDIEGGEIEAFRGGVSSLKATPLLFVELHIAFLKEGELAEMLELLWTSGYRHFEWVDRYYDSPWSSKRARSRAVQKGPYGKLYETVMSRRYPVLSLFAGA
jgi:FkbM family methyltransferase